MTWIVTAERRYASSHNLSEIEEALDDSSFRRIHRNTLINLGFIRKLNVISSQRWSVMLENGDEFVVSKSQAKTVRALLRC